MKFGSWTYHSLKVDLRFATENDFDLSTYMENGEWTIKGILFSYIYIVEILSGLIFDWIRFGVKENRKNFWYLCTIPPRRGGGVFVEKSIFVQKPKFLLKKTRFYPRKCNFSANTKSQKEHTLFIGSPVFNKIKLNFDYGQHWPFLVFLLPISSDLSNFYPHGLQSFSMGSSNQT